MSRVLIIYDSRTGNTEKMARAVYEGASSTAATVAMRKANQATLDDLLGCEVVIFGTPTNFGYMSGHMKEFFERLWVTVGDMVANRRYAAFTSSGGGGKGALDSIDGICDAFNSNKQFKFTRFGDGVVATGSPTSRVLMECRELGRKGGAMITE